MRWGQWVIDLYNFGFMIVNPEQFLELAKKRRSMGLSHLSADPVDRNILEKLFEAANWGQSHKDTEPWRFTVFTGDGREKLAEMFIRAHLAEHPDGDEVGARKRAFAAPVWIAIGMNPGLNEDGSFLTNEEEEIMAVATAVQNMHLMARAFGLTGLWHSKGLSVHEEVANGLGWEKPKRLLGFFMLGWPTSDWPEGERGDFLEKVTFVSA